MHIYNRRMVYAGSVELNNVGWLILLPPGVSWDIMWYESEPLPYYTELRNRSYSFMLNYTDSPSTPKVHLPHPGTTISSYGSSPASASPQRRVRKCGSMPPFLLCSPSNS